MRKIVAAILLCGLTLTANAVPAKRGWQTKTQADGTTIEVQLLGDEFYHYTINRDGKQVRLNEAGMYEVVGEAPSRAKVQALRASARKARKEFGISPNLAPRGIVIMVNFSDKSFDASHTRVVIDSLCNAKDCKVNKSGNTMYPSAGEYFLDQSNGLYHPIFDVYGPVTLSHNMRYYGQNDGEGNDLRPAVAVVEACKLLESSVDFTLYDSDNDGKIDFVYMIYAGEGEASTEVTDQIWPHAYSIDEEFDIHDTYFTNVYPSKNDCKVDGKQVNTYACSAELSGNDLDGIGTLCHEFSHVMGLPDFYDTNYGTNYSSALTPNDWDVMDGGAYNGDGHCPPNYSAWEKYFFGWHTPINLGNEGRNLTLKANGTDGYQAYQINTGGTQITATTSGECYYIENRQQVGWDRGLPHHGMLIWKVNYDQSAWVNNEPNNTANSPRYTIVSAYGSAIGWDGSTDNCKWNTFPGTKNKTSYTGISGKPLLNIAESNQLITLTYIEEPVIPIDPFNVVFKVDDEDFATVEHTSAKLVLPATQPAACQDGRVLMGWCSIANYSSETTAPTFAKAGDAVAEGAIFYAIFANETTNSNAEPQSTTYTFTSKSWADATSSWTGTKDGLMFINGQGVQVTAGVTGAGAETKTALSDVSKVVVSYCTNTKNGVGSIEVSVGNNAVAHDVTKVGGTTLRDLEFAFDNASGKVGLEVTCTTNSIYVNKVTITCGGGKTYSNYSTQCSYSTDIEETIAAPKARKIVVDGQVLIVRDGIRYTLLGQPIR